MTNVSSTEIVKPISSQSEFKKNGFLYLKISVLILGIYLTLFFCGLPESKNYIVDLSDYTEYIVNAFWPISLYNLCTIVIGGFFIVLTHEIKLRVLIVFHIVIALSMLIGFSFLSATENQTKRITQCTNMLINLDSESKSIAQSISKEWLSKDSIKAKHAEESIKNCVAEVDKSLGRISNKVINISKPKTQLSLQDMQGRKINGVTFSIAQEDKLTTCFDQLKKSGQFGQEMMMKMIDDLKRNGINQDPSFVINQCEGNLALVDMSLNGPQKLENFWN